MLQGSKGIAQCHSINKKLYQHLNSSPLASKVCVLNILSQDSRVGGRSGHTLIGNKKILLYSLKNTLLAKYIAHIIYLIPPPEHTCLTEKTMPVFLFINIIVKSNYHSVQFSSVPQSCPTLCNPLNHSMPGLPVHHQLPESTQTHVHWVSGAIQPSHPLSSPSPPALNLSQHQGLFQWVSSSQQVAKVLEYKIQQQSFQ